jgi:ABC-type proline/glycine betaine transport system substrate-binding protein
MSSTVLAASISIASKYSRNTFWKNQWFPRASSRETMTSRSKAGADNPEKGVRNWLKDNQDVVQPWVKAAKEAG